MRFVRVSVAAFRHVRFHAALRERLYTVRGGESGSVFPRFHGFPRSLPTLAPIRTPEPLPPWIDLHKTVETWFSQDTWFDCSVQWHLCPLNPFCSLPSVFSQQPSILTNHSLEGKTAVCLQIFRRGTSPVLSRVGCVSLKGELLFFFPDSLNSKLWKERGSSLISLNSHY